MENQAIWSIVHKAWGISSHKHLIYLMDKIGAQTLWQLSEHDFRHRFTTISDDLVKKLYQVKQSIDLQRIIDNLTKYDIKIINYYDKNYPGKLKNIYNPPAILYVKGNFALPDLTIAMVGSRQCTEYGKKVAHSLATAFSENGVMVASGLALGIDTSSHLGALNGAGGTVAVLGCGVDVVYPRSNKPLYAQILAHENGAIISELPLGTEPLRYHFPLRNRIISGLADGLVIVEATLKSGALITAELALEQGKDIFAVPGSIFVPQSEGVHKLIKEGAKLITCIDDVLEEYGQLCLFTEEIAQDKDVQLSDQEKNVLNCVSVEPISVEELGILTKLPIGEMMAALSWLEINGLIQQVIGRKFMRLG